MSSGFRALLITFFSFCIEAYLSSAVHCAVPIVEAYPAVSANPIVADDTTIYSVTTTISDASGYNHIICVRVLFNYTEAGGDSSKGRGYMAWGTSDATITKYGGTWVLANATNGGRWGYNAAAWGGTTYIRPISCTVSNSGKATGGKGYRTISWTFTALPAWAANPLTNDADVWMEDQDGNKVGWSDNPDEFDVVSSTCVTQASTPKAPIVSNATSDSIQIAINPADSDSNVFCVRIYPAYDGKNYVQPDGSLGATPYWQSKSAWGTVTVRGLTGSMTYSFRARAWQPVPGVCPSAFGEEATVTTLINSHVVDTTAPGKLMHRGIIGNATHYGFNSQAWSKTWDILYDTCARGIAGGLDADTYNWKDLSGQGVGHTGSPGPNVHTTLEWMRLIRDHRSIPLVTINTKGIGPLSASGYCRFYYTDTSIETLKKLAADWVRYVNFILPTYRQGDTLLPSDQAILDSINWGSKPKLLEPGEAPTPKVIYWEIGNEPEVALPWCTPDVPRVTLDGPAYASRYKALAEAMLAVDPEIKLGPCMLAPNPSLATLDAVLADHSIPVHFIAYHPYGPLRTYALRDGDNARSAEAALRYVKTQQQAVCANVIASIVRSGRCPQDIALISSEYNPSSWEWECSQQILQVSQALGLAETLFTYAELGLFAANYWSVPVWCADGTESPMYKVFKMMQKHWGEKLIDSYSDGLNLRVYTTWNSKTQELCLWCLNFSNDCDKPVRLSLQGFGSASRVLQMRLQNLSGTTSLLDRNDPPASAPPVVEWVTSDLTGSISPSDFVVVLPHATITLLAFHKSLPISDIRTKPNGESVGLNDALVSAVFDEFFYITCDDRTCGIRVVGPTQNISVGCRVCVTGLLETNADGERQIRADSVTVVTPNQS
jgi:hypothetical protein